MNGRISPAIVLFGHLLRRLEFLDLLRYPVCPHVRIALGEVEKVGFKVVHAASSKTCSGVIPNASAMNLMAVCKNASKSCSDIEPKAMERGTSTV